MGKVYRGDIELSIGEYLIIKDVMKTGHSINIVKDIEIEDGKDLFNIRCEIKNNHMFNKHILLSTIITKNGSTNLLVEEDMSYSQISILIGVKRFRVDTKTNEAIDFFINVDKVFNRAVYLSKEEFYKSKLNILNWQMKKGEDICLENEIYYRRFENKLDLAFATYSILANPSHFNKAIQDLYMDKLYYAGMEIDDYMEEFEFSNLTEDIDRFKYSVDIEYLFRYMLTIVNYIVIGKLDKEADAEFSAKAGYELMDRYIKVYDFN